MFLGQYGLHTLARVLSLQGPVVYRADQRCHLRLQSALFLCVIHGEFVAIEPLPTGDVDEARGMAMPRVLH